MFVALLLGVLPAGQNPLPRFEDYPAQADWKGLVAALKLTSRSQRLYRTRLHQAAAQPPSFAGHYRFVEWGCGSYCAAGALIDLETGQVIGPPLAWAPDDFAFPPTAWESGDIESRADSRLLIVTCDAGWPDRAPDTYYFVLEDQHFRQLAHLRGKKRTPEPV